MAQEHSIPSLATHGPSVARDAALCVGVYFISLCPVLAGLLGRDVLTSEQPREMRTVLFCSDARHYLDIAQNGYNFSSTVKSTAAFFPTYPLIARLVAAIFELSVETALVIVAHLALLMALTLAYVYFKSRTCLSHAEAKWALLFFALMPPSLFFRLPYSESIFVLAGLVAYVAVERARSLMTIALVIGVVSATRPVGVAFVPLLWLAIAERVRRGHRAIAALLLTPIALWGLVVFVVSQIIEFGEPLAIYKAQKVWDFRPDFGIWDKLAGLTSCEPFWTVYCPNSPGFWGRNGNGENALFNLHFANPLYFLGTTFLVAYGGIKGWLNRYELMLAAGLLAVPYITRAHEMYMASHGRFAAVVFPAFVVVGRLLGHTPALGVLAAIMCWVLMAVYAAYFIAGYVVI